jgi:hypothetical protein
VKYNSIEDVWLKYQSLNVATGAICSSELKRAVREKFQKDHSLSFQAFGFEIDEKNRIMGMAMNYPGIQPIFPLALLGLTKKNCMDIVIDAGIMPPRTYQLGFNNNNCFETGCVQGGIGYWQKMMREYPDKFDRMSNMEFKLTDLKGEPVTMLKDQSKGGGKVFLKHNPKYPDIKDITMMKGWEPKPLMECNGFCGVNDLTKRSETEQEINYEL